MGRVLKWGAFFVFAICVVGMVAWPLWSDNDLWSFLFAGIGIAVLFPVIFVPPIRTMLRVFSTLPPSDEE